MGVEEGGGEEREGKETDRCPLTHYPPSKGAASRRAKITRRSPDCQEVARSALVKEIESKRAALMWHTAPVIIQTQHKPRNTPRISIM
jgi:hypothetical protein